MKYIWNIYIRNLAYNYIFILGFVFWSFCASNKLSWEGRWCKGIPYQNMCNIFSLWRGNTYAEATMLSAIQLKAFFSCFYIISQKRSTWKYVKMLILPKKSLLFMWSSIFCASILSPFLLRSKSSCIHTGI